MIGEYQITSVLGEGGMGTVYGAVHPLIGKRAAIKVLAHRFVHEPEVLARFVQEARAANEIRHPNIVDVFSFGELPDGRAYFIMEQLEGRSLGTFAKNRQLSIGETAFVFEQIAKAIAAAHRKGIVHRDLKPENIFLVDGEDGRPRVKVLDFGIAKLQPAEDGESQNLTSSGVLLGTPAYMSPEQARSLPVSAAADVYSLGVMLFESLTGRRPFLSASAMDLVIMHVQSPVPDPRSLRPDIPGPIADMVVRMMAKEPARRPSLDEVRELMRLFIAGPPATTANRVVDNSLILKTLYTTPARAASSSLATELGNRRRARMWIAGVSALGVALSVGIGAAVISSGRPSPSVAAQDASPAPAEQVVASASADAAPAVLAASGVDAAPLDAAPPARGGTLTVRVGVEGASVLVDGQAVDIVDGEAALELAENGRHRVLVRAPGYTSFQTVVGISGEPVVVEPELVRSVDKKPVRRKSPDKSSPNRTKKTTPKRKGRLIADPF